MSFYLPPLRERVQDIGPLARGMAARFAQKFGKELFAISPEAMAAVEAYSWPGNIRQLENVIQQSVRSEEHTSELQSHLNLVCRLLLEKKKKQNHTISTTPPCLSRTDHRGANDV